VLLSSYLDVEIVGINLDVKIKSAAADGNRGVRWLGRAGAGR
jgi:hypothetical protein